MMIMKVAIPTNDNKGLDSRLSADYARCKFFLIADLDDGKIGAYKVIFRDIPEEVNDVRGAEAFLLAGKGVGAVIVHKILEKDRLSLVGNNIRVFLGASGKASDALKQYSDGKLKENSDCKNGDICEC
jgi:predicted Fe-Mo cluster-binding NifX family protein